ncbi:virulence factor TspB C-terminal domain-related protein [Acinetobacter baumannii]|uniref:virulence factor TspB C-terminal domain-related protein n=1 Tax=Acinetobacter baumannii TaxID=470 RepID=UPI0039EF4CB9
MGSEMCIRDSAYSYNPQLQYLWKSSVTNKLFETIDPACDYLTVVNGGKGIPGYSYSHYTLNSSGTRATCYYNDKDWSSADRVPNPDYKPESIKCPVSGTPVPVYFEPNTPIPLRVCKQNPNGSYCVYDAPDKLNPIVITSGNYQNITLRSVSEIPMPSCTPEFSKSSCDPKDPYGGCYQPPNDNCNRMSDGSIYCPPDEPPPPIKSGCQNGATYCDMPPTGCGTGYVPGTYNGKQICVKNSNPPPTDPPDQPPPASDPPPITPPDPSDPPDPGDPPPPPPPPPPPSNDPLLRAILDAINAVNNKLTWLKNELVNSLNYIAKKIDVTNSKLDTTNQKLDTVNSSIKETTAAVNANGDKVKAAVDANATTVKTAVEANTAATNGVKSAVEANTSSTANKLNEVVNAINNKPVGGGGTAVNLEPTNNLLKGIQDWLAVSDDTNPEDGEIKVVKNEIDTNFDGNLVNATGTCPQPMQISFSIVQTYTIQFSYETFCLGASLARPWIIFVGMLTAFFIVTGHYRGGSND